MKKVRKSKPVEAQQIDHGHEDDNDDHGHGHGHDDDWVHLTEQDEENLEEIMRLRNLHSIEQALRQSIQDELDALNHHKGIVATIILGTPTNK